MTGRPSLHLIELTDKQTEVLSHLARGLDQPAISRVMQINPNTVRRSKPMWGSKSRRIAELESFVAFLHKKLDAARSMTVQPAKVGPDWQKLAMKYAEDRVADAQAADREVARLQDVAKGLAKLARTDERRSLRLARAAVRYWAEIGKLRKTVAERDTRVAELEDRLGGDRAIKAAVPRKDPAVAELRLAQEQIAKMDAQLQILEKANAAQDVRRPSLQKAS